MNLRSSRRRGNALIELALATTLMVPILIGTFEFGYTFYVYNLLSTQVRGGSRYASFRTFRCMDTASVDKYKAAIRNMVRTSSPDGSGALIIPGLADANVLVEIVDQNGVAADNANVPATVTVSAVNFNIYSVFATMRVHEKPSVTFPYLGRYAPAESEP